MNLFKNIRIKWKVIGLAMSVSATALLLATAGYLVFEWTEEKRMMTHNLLSGIKIVGLNSSGCG